jgi:uncharacterized iron-regulated membrane protein
MIRGVFVWLHRWVGLAMTLFLVIVGLTGSLLAFNEELERVFAPQIFAKIRPGATPLDLATLAEKAPVIAHAQLAEVSRIGRDQAIARYDAERKPGSRERYDIGFTQLFLDPWTGEEIARRRRGDLSEGLINLMPFIYLLHDSFVPILSKSTGALVLGIVAVFWTLDCFNGVYLTLPVALSGFWRKWKIAWAIKGGGGAYRLNLDLHRASGLWLWPMLFVFAWSSVMFNMTPLYNWVTPKLFEYHSIIDDLMAVIARLPKQDPTNLTPNPPPDWRKAQAVGARLMAEKAAKHGFVVGEPGGLRYWGKFYSYSTHSSGSSLLEKGAGVMFESDTGEVLLFFDPSHEATGNTISNWLAALHTAHVFGLPYKIFVFVIGWVIALLSVTGVYIWWMKWKARRFRKKRGASAPPLDATTAE